jgi:dihydrofolate reductase
MSAKLTYGMGVSLDGYVNDVHGGLDWVSMDDELHSWYNRRAAEMTAFIYGRGMYETMAGYWPTALDDPASNEVTDEFARIWLPKPKYVFSSTLEDVAWNSTLLRDDAIDGVARLKQELDGELEISGATIAGSAIVAGLVDEYEVMLNPATTGGGTPFFPVLEDGLRLRLVETRPFSVGAVLLRYVPR